MKNVTTKEHYELLIQEGNDPFNDPPIAQDYMDKWDGQPFINALSLTRHSLVLEIGVGTGRLAKKVLQSGCQHFTGIDLSPATIERAKVNLKDWNNKSLLHEDFISYPFMQTFDTIYCSLTLFHFENKRLFLQKAADLLSKGRIVLSTSKAKEPFFHFATRTVALFPDDPDALKTLLSET